MSTFTRIYLNPRKRGGRKLLTNPEAMHAAVRAAFPPDIDTGDSRVLWRADSQGDEHVLYIVGPETPDATHIVEQAGWDTRPPQSADYGRLQDSLMKGQRWAFELVANPVSSQAGAHGTRGKVVAHSRPNSNSHGSPSVRKLRVSRCLTTPAWSVANGFPSARGQMRNRGGSAFPQRVSRERLRSPTLMCSDRRSTRALAVRALTAVAC